MDNDKKISYDDFSESQKNTLKQIYKRILSKSGREEADKYLKKYFREEEIDKIHKDCGISPLSDILEANIDFSDISVSSIEKIIEKEKKKEDIDENRLEALKVIKGIYQDIKDKLLKEKKSEKSLDDLLEKAEEKTKEKDNKKSEKDLDNLLENANNNINENSAIIKYKRTENIEKLFDDEEEEKKDVDKKKIVTYKRIDEEPPRRKSEEELDEMLRDLEDNNKNIENKTK